MNHSRAREPSGLSSTMVMLTPSRRGSRTSLRRRKFTSSRIGSGGRTERAPSPSRARDSCRSRRGCFCFFHLPMGAPVPGCGRSGEGESLPSAEMATEMIDVIDRCGVVVVFVVVIVLVIVVISFPHHKGASVHYR